MAKRKNNPLFSVGQAYSVDAVTGEKVPLEGGGFKMLPGPPGSCEWCHAYHDPALPHNRDSLPYQMKFHQLHGRYPTWTDAMAHCHKIVRETARLGIIKVLTDLGREIPDDLKS